ncbi:MAG: ABC transporter permease [Acidimicrobiia bacterium]
MTSTEIGLVVEVEPDPGPPAAAVVEEVVVRRRRPLPGLGFWLAVGVLAVVTAWTVAPSVVTSSDPITAVPAERLLPPSLDHPFGTDELGRDQLTRVVHGARATLVAAGLASAIALVVGTLLGLVAGTVGRWLDDLIMRVVDLVLAIPALLFAMALAAPTNGSAIGTSVALGIAGMGAVARVMRASVLRVRSSMYVDAARSIGARSVAIMFKHVLPNSIGPILAMVVTSFGQFILTIAAMSFLGFGAPPPDPEWGSMVESGREFLVVAWWMTSLPAAVIALVVLSSNRIAQQLEPRSGLS